MRVKTELIVGVASAYYHEISGAFQTLEQMILLFNKSSQSIKLA